MESIGSLESVDIWAVWKDEAKNLETTYKMTLKVSLAYIRCPLVENPPLTIRAAGRPRAISESRSAGQIWAQGDVRDRLGSLVPKKA